MKKKITLVIIMFTSFLFSQVNFNLDFSFEKINSSDELTNLQLFDYNNDGMDEIVAGFANSNSMGIVCYDFNGDTLFVHSEEIGQNINFQKSYIFSNENSYLLLTASTFNNLEDKDKILIKLYSFENFTLIDSVLYEISIPPCDFFNSPEIESLLISDNLIIYLGYSLETHWEASGIISTEKSTLACFSLSNSISHLADIDESGETLYLNENTNHLISTGCHRSIDSGSQWHYESATYFTTLINNEPNLFNLNVNTISGWYESNSSEEYWCDFPYNYQIVSTTNKISDLDGYILYYQIYDGEDYILNFIKYTLDFSDTLWIKHDTMTGYGRICSSTCVNTNIGDHYIMYFKPYGYPVSGTYYEVRNIITGDIVLSGISDIYPFSIMRNLVGELYFFEEQVNDIGYNVYIIEGEIFLSNDNNLLVPIEIRLSNFPNPFNPSTTIEFSIQNDSNVELTIFNIRGQKIKTFAQNEFTKGSHSLIWNGVDESGKPVSSGLYFYKLNVNGKTEAVKKCVLLK